MATNHSHAGKRRTKTDDISKAQKHMGHAKHEGEQAGSMAREFAEEKFSELKDAAGRQLERGRDQAMDMGRQIERYVRQKPLKSLLIAAGVGFFLGRFRR